MEKHILIIGAGPGGYVAAVRAAQAGARVTVVERDHLGGTCLNWGCIPSKVLLHATELLEKSRHGAAFGLIFADPLAVDLARLMARKQKVVDDQRKGIAALFRHHNIRWMAGRARVTGPGRARVEQADGQVQELSWDRLILAPGTRPMGLPGLEPDGERVWSSDHALSMSQVPRSMVIVGGGVIGCEFATILSALGTKVTLVEALDRLLPLPSVDADCSKILEREMKKRKVALHLGRTVQDWGPDGDGLRVVLGPSPLVEPPKGKKAEPVTVGCDKILVCVGRRPNTDDLGLSGLGVAMDERGWIKADESMQTNVDGVYAIGDVLGPARVMLAHVASAEGQVAASCALGGRERMDYDAVPGAIFCRPEVATVGLTEAQALERGMEVRSETVLLRTMGKAQVLGELAGMAKLVTERGSGRLVGAHLVGAHATELIAEATLAVRHAMTAEDLARTIHAHPTLAEVMAEAAFKATDRALHG
ncbi:dihydrolipoamide dehydrogenase [Desulfacinum hydrothermale DSM 13146]|uniref:Dihydrolipoyl dehydrogenase n=1 Tax=Desulfacinum hydrothermale DSM 13146 TaxID=1121390 RepID=A0A1W1XVG6_9BACT|nr:dihydrolipoyl dehydrogenase [Desulfacinum hydrothermale]SMC27877.1 dihydrolipoamide dehydrogenase [Desulfacinum hydrothermale DSM 13146]